LARSRWQLLPRNTFKLRSPWVLIPRASASIGLRLIRSSATVALPMWTNAGTASRPCSTTCGGSGNSPCRSASAATPKGLSTGTANLTSVCSATAEHRQKSWGRIPHRTSQATENRRKPTLPGWSSAADAEPRIGACNSGDSGLSRRPAQAWRSEKSRDGCGLHS